MPDDLDAPLAAALLGQVAGRCQTKAVRAALLELAVRGALGIEQRSGWFGQPRLVLLPRTAPPLPASLRAVHELVVQAAKGRAETSAKAFGRKFAHRYGSSRYVRDVLAPQLAERGLARRYERLRGVMWGYELTPLGEERRASLDALLGELRRDGDAAPVDRLRQAGAAVLLLDDPHELDLGAPSHVDADALAQLAHAAHHAAHAAMHAGGGHGHGGGGGHH